MSSRVIIVTTGALLLVSFSVLFVVEAKNHNYDYKKSWSAVYFENPRDNSLDFTIENHQGEKIEYDYEISIGDDKVIDEKVKIEAGAKQKIQPGIENERLKNQKITITVSFKDRKYEIYKNLEK